MPPVLLSRRSVFAAAALALALMLAGANVSGRTSMTYSDIMGCERSCEVAAAGLPIPFIADYPGLSPANNADLMGALIGLDRVLWGRAAGAFAFWSAVSAAAASFGAWVVRTRRAG